MKRISKLLKGAMAAIAQWEGMSPLAWPHRMKDICGEQTAKSPRLSQPTLRPLATGAILSVGLLFSITVGATEISHSPEDEYVQHINATKAVAPLGDNLFGDSINEYSGKAQFSVTDVSLPGNSGLAVTLARHLDVQSVAEAIEHKQPFSEWDLDIPYLHMTESYGYQWRTGTANVRCAQSDLTKAAPPNGDGSDAVAGATWHGNFLYVPGRGDAEILHLSDTATNKPTDGAAYHWVTKDQWYFSCLSTTANGWTGDAFLARAPDGTKYWFNQFAAQQIPELMGIPTDYGQGPIQIPQTAPRDEVRIMPTRVEDRFGNYIIYAYDPANPQRLVSITANDGRQITLTYGANGHVSSVSDGTRVWTYQYYTNGSMSGVTLPDGSKWAYVWPSDYDFKTIDSAGCGHPGSFNPSYRTITFTHPSGAVGSFIFKYRAHGRTYVPQMCKEIHDFQEFYSMSWDQIPPFFVAFSLEQKQITGPGIPTRTWTWTYPAFYWAYTASCASGSCPTTKVISVAEPDGSVTRNTYGMQYAVNEGMLLKTERLPNATASAIRTTTMDYQFVQTGQTYGPVGDSFRYETEPNAGTPSPLRQVQITQQGATFTWQVNNTSGVYSFDSFARPLAVTKSSSLGNTRTDVTAYSDDFTKWVFGQVKTVTKTVPTPSVVMSQTDYDANDLPWRVYSYGKLQNTFTYNADGTAATIADGNGNVTTLSSWKRGFPQAVKYPATPEAPSGASVAAAVDNLGQISSVTDENGYKTCYTYDPMGRMASITYPSETTAGVCDTTAWNTTTQSFAPYAGTEHGIPAGHWKQTITNGNAVKINFFDAMWHPLIEEKYDSANLVPTRSYVVKAYDLAGNLAYQSYPFQTLLNMYTTVTVGTTTSYDALGRVYEVDQESELGTLATTTEYLTGFKTKVTLPGWQGTSAATTTSYMAYDQPTTDWPVTISHPEGANTVIYRNEFGNPVYLTRKDATGSVSATRTYVYDVNQLLCKMIDPESAATLMDYDLAGNPSWSASGQALFTTACDRTSVPVGSRTVRTYDARNRVSALTFPDGHGNKSYTYAPDGQPSTISTTNSDTSLVTTTYGYNKRRLPVSEQLAWGSTLWTIGYGYDANANLSSTTYPNGMNIPYAPNALGQATQAGTYATGVTYYPNGAIKTFTYGNGIVHTLTLNARQLPDTSRDAGTAADVLNDGYDYDGDGNVAAITDALPGGRGNRNMTYDGLDRLKTAQSVMFGNTGAVATASYNYDVLDNLTQVTVPATALVSAKNNFYCYDTSKWLLTSVRTGSCTGAVVTSLSYDVQGNVINKNGQLYNFDKENRMLGVNSSVTYRYDGLGRRVTAVIGPSNPQTTSYLYSKAGQLLYERTNSSVTADIYLSGSLVARTSLATTVPGAVYVPKYQHTDALGSPVAVTDANQAVTLRSEYEPYGVLLNRTLLDGPGYTGHVSDSATGLSYMQQRYYDPQLGRFLSVDPASADPGVGGNFNRYWYANNNPYRFTDPDGRNPPGCGDGHCRGIMLFGTLAQRQAVYQRIQELKAASPELKRRAEALEHSQYAQRIKDSSLNPARRNYPANVNLTSPLANESNHVGTGTTTYYNANQWMTPVGSRMGSPAGVLAHELLSHAFDKNQGTNDSSKDPDTGFDRDEERANKVEKIYVESAKPQKKDN